MSLQECFLFYIDKIFQRIKGYMKNNNFTTNTNSQLKIYKDNMQKKKKLLQDSYINKIKDKNLNYNIPYYETASQTFCRCTTIVIQINGCL